MKSPFPGMDPYLKQHWADVHHRLTTCACDQLQPRLPGQLRARVEERVFVEIDEGVYRAVHPDVGVVEYPRGPGEAAAVEAGVAVDEPLVLHLDDEPTRQGYLEIIDVASGNRVVTVIEFLSPTNKVPGEGQDLYLRKQREVLAARASLVEIDLTRSGQRVLSVPPERIPPSYRTTYQAVVRRCWQPDRAEVYRMPLERALPRVRVPLRQTDAAGAASLDRPVLRQRALRRPGLPGRPRPAARSARRGLGRRMAAGDGGAVVSQQVGGATP